MIVVTRLNGPALTLSSTEIERAEETPDTVLTLVNGKTFVVQETLAEVIEQIRNYRVITARSRHQVGAEQHSHA